MRPVCSMKVDTILFTTNHEEQPMGRKTYPEEYREQIVALARAGRSYSSLARELNRRSRRFGSGWSGLPMPRTFRPGKVCCTSRSCWMCLRVGLWVGPWQLGKTRSSWYARCRWRYRDGTPSGHPSLRLGFSIHFEAFLGDV